MLDGSTSINEEELGGKAGNFEHMKTFAQQVVADLGESVTTGRLHVAALTFAADVDFRFGFNDYQNKDVLADAISGIAFKNKFIYIETDFQNAMTAVRQEFEGSIRNLKTLRRRDWVQTHVVILTNGLDTSGAAGKAALASEMEGNLLWKDPSIVRWAFDIGIPDDDRVLDLLASSQGVPLSKNRGRITVDATRNKLVSALQGICEPLS